MSDSSNPAVTRDGHNLSVRSLCRPPWELGFGMTINLVRSPDGPVSNVHPSDFDSEGRLAVVELKADEDIHLPLQGIDYWSRVAWHHARGEFQKFGYFAGRELSTEPPLLMMVAPALHVHPATDTLLRYISPEIDWTLIGIDERWKRIVRVVFRKRPEKLQLRTAV